MTTTPVTVTDSASIYLAKTLAAKKGMVFRLTIKKTGCSGYSYLPEVVDVPRTSDIAMTVSPELTIYLDQTWLHLLEGITIDYVEEEKMGLKQKRLLFINPKESSRCGCGESFHIE
jgi:iron-sulfur cluster assembly protein